MTIRRPRIFATCCVLTLCAFAGSPRESLADDIASSTDPRIHLEVYSATSTLFDGEISVAPCAPSASSSPASSAYCAIGQSGLESSWTSYGESRFLDSVGGIGSDGAKGWYWGWFANLDYGQVSLDQHQVVDGEDLMVIIGRMPLKIVLSTTTPVIGSTTTVSVYEFGFDDSWNGVWLPSASSSLFVDGVEVPSGGGSVYDLSVSTSTPFRVIARRDGFLDSRAVEVVPVESALNVVIAPPVIEDRPVSSGGSSSGGHQGVCVFDLEKAFVFLESKQRADGSFGSSLYGDWSAIALSAGSRGSSLERAKDAVIRDPAGLSTATDYERRAMALMSLGVNPVTGTSIDYVQEILSRFNGVQVDDPSLVNDDIFAIFPLIRSGYSPSDPVVTSIAAFIISRQSVDGSWGQSVDLTAAAIQSLSLVSDIDGTRGAMDLARSYIRSRQRDDGGFGSSFSTSWSLQAISAMGENGSAWAMPGGTPASSLCVLQAGDGGVGPVTDDDNTRLWATAYAIPAVMGKTWPAIMHSFPRVSVSRVSVTEAPAAAETPVTPLASSTVASTSSMPSDIVRISDGVDTVRPPVRGASPAVAPLVRLPDVKIDASTTSVSAHSVEEVSVGAVAASGVDMSPRLIATAGIILSLAVFIIRSRAR